jgi:hypothetical protein
MPLLKNVWGNRAFMDNGCSTTGIEKERSHKRSITPPGFDCGAGRWEPCTTRVSATCDNGSCLLRVADNGIGLPGGLDLLASRSLGLRLVNFLACHAETAFTTGKGTEFIFTLHQQENCS